MTPIKKHLSSHLKSDTTIKVALLFGSAATDQLGPESDVDIAVSIGTSMTADQQINLRDRIASLVGRPVDLIDLETAHGSILKQSLTLGMPLIPSQPQTLERLMKRMVYEQEDLAPQIHQAKKTRVITFAYGK
jgi:predicted nucleotidyltransferase